jgi:RimJ/RimL family protein N-acetyltransferase
MFGPELTGGRLRLRAPVLSDIAYFSRWFADGEVMRYWWMRDTRWSGRPRLAAARLFFGAKVSRTAILWTIEHAGKPIGHCHVRQIDRVRSKATAAVLIGERSEQGKGFAREALALRNEFVFHQLGIDKIVASALANNVASHGVLERSGYRLVRTAKDSAIVDGQKRDVLHFELLRSEYEQRHPTVARADTPIPASPNEGAVYGR